MLGEAPDAYVERLRREVEVRIDTEAKVDDAGKVIDSTCMAGQRKPLILENSEPAADWAIMAGATGSASVRTIWTSLVPLAL